MRSFWVWSLAFVVIAGCTDAPDPADDAGPSADTDPVSPATSQTEDGRDLDFDAGIPVPVWQVGDWWSYTVQYDSGESYEARIVVYDEAGGQYLITSDDRDLMVRSSFNHYPNFAPVSKSDLGQTIHDRPVSDLRFPMKNGTWSGTYRDFGAEWETTYATLSTPNGDVPGFTTVMRDSGDGLARITQSWSPVTKWFTSYAFDFDGAGPVDVTYTLQDWGSGFTGTLPVVDVVDGVHRTFPAYGVAPPDPADPPAAPGVPEATDAMTLQEEGASLLWGMFAGAGGPGDFRFELTHQESAIHHSFPWQPSGAGPHFGWGELTDQPTGEWQVTGIGAAQDFAFLFLEVYEVRTAQVDVATKSTDA